MMNIDYLKSLLGDDNALVNRFLEVFQNEIPAQLSDLENAIENEDWDNVSNTAHAIKSQVKYLELTEIADLAYRIERNAEQRNNLAEISMDYEDLERALFSALEELEN